MWILGTLAAGGALYAVGGWDMIKAVFKLAFGVAFLAMGAMVL